MKICNVGDIHWSTFSSILRRMGPKYSMRLENCIKSINWVEEFFKDVDLMVYGGDFFDKAELNAQEISALNEIKWNDRPHVFICGNHEMGMNNSQFSSAKLFELCPNCTVISDNTTTDFASVELCYLPYVLESDRKPLKDIFGEKTKTRIIFSHNDIQGIQYGMYESKIGFTVNEIQSECDLFMNGHIHNGTRVSSKIINIGNLTGQNFSEDATKYKHSVYLIDTDTIDVQEFENPYAFNFYKFDATQGVPNLYSLKGNSAVTLKCFDYEAEHYRSLLKDNLSVVESRLNIALSKTSDVQEDKQQELTLDHLNSFNDYFIELMGGSDIVLAELQEVLK